MSHRSDSWQHLGGRAPSPARRPLPPLPPAGRCNCSGHKSGPIQANSASTARSSRRARHGNYARVLGRVRPKSLRPPRLPQRLRASAVNSCPEALDERERRGVAEEDAEKAEMRCTGAAIEVQRYNVPPYGRLEGRSSNQLQCSGLARWDLVSAFYSRSFAAHLFIRARRITLAANLYFPNPQFLTRPRRQNRPSRLLYLN